MNSLQPNNWSKRFIYASIIQGAIFTGLTIFLVVSQISFLKPEVSRVIAGGNAGTWFLLGYLMYIIVGVIGVAVSALLYSYTYSKDKSGGKTLKVRNMLAGSHLTLMNLGTVLTCGLLMYGGYHAGASMLSEEVGGKGFTSKQAHAILGPLSEPIAYSILLLSLGVLCGGVGFVIYYMQSKKNISKEMHNPQIQSRDG